GNIVSPSHLFSFHHRLYFFATFGTTQWLWQSDGTMSGTFAVQDLHAAASSSAGNAISQVVFVGSLAYFVSNSVLWRTDGTTSGTAQIKNLLAPGARVDVVDVNGRLILDSYLVNPLLGDTLDLWTSDGTEQGTFLIHEFHGAKTSIISPTWLTSF